MYIQNGVNFRTVNILVEYVFCEHGEFTQIVNDQFSIRFPGALVPNQHSVRALIREMSNNDYE